MVHLQLVSILAEWRVLVNVLTPAPVVWTIDVCA